MPWQVEFLDEAVEAELFALSYEVRASFERIVGLIAEHGLERLREP